MKHSFSISFHGEVISTAEEDKDGEATIAAITEAVRDSFQPDLLHGVKVRGVSIHIDEMTTHEDEAGKKDA